MTWSITDTIAALVSIILLGGFAVVLYDALKDGQVRNENELNCATLCPKVYAFETGVNHDYCYCSIILTRIYK